MSLKDLVIPTATTETAGVKIVVRGLSLSHVLHLVREEAVALAQAYTRLSEGALADQDVLAIANDLLTTAPDLAAKIIAVAAGDPDEWEKVRDIAFPDQLEMLENVGRLTFTAEDGLKKALETVMRFAQGATRALEDQAVSESSSGTFAPR